MWVGPGGYHSVITNGPGSMGAAIFAVAPALFVSGTNRAIIGGTVGQMMNHPFTTAATPARQTRPSAIPGALDNIPTDGFWYQKDTYWSWGDGANGMVWINGPNKRGVLSIRHLVRRR